MLKEKGGGWSESEGVLFVHLPGDIFMDRVGSLLARAVLLVGLGFVADSMAPGAEAKRQGAEQTEAVARLRLVPFPKKVSLIQGTLLLKQAWILELPAGMETLGQLISEEMVRAGLDAPQRKERTAKELRFRLVSSQASSKTPDWEPPAFRAEATDEDYCLRVGPEEIVGCGKGGSGLFYAVQTLCQLLRANRIEGTQLPCLVIEDWPSLRWRCFQDDMTRGPSTKLASLQRSIVLGAYLKHNLWTYYMEYQYAFRKHPEIGPPDGSLEPEELKALVEYAKKFHTEVLGNQQSFGHFERILKHEKYAHLREKPHLLSPVREETYQLLDDLYSEVCPLLPFEMFNVCCDETWGLGEGPSKELAQKIGVGGVYVQHIRRVHELLSRKYKKRTMMWGDIILQHPEHLEQIPKDVIMLTWGYGPAESFEHQIIPFQKSGYEFFVCPGISNWSRILPDFEVAEKNIRNFVRDGAKHGALGMLNTDWEDDGEALQGYRWHGHAWGGECAWNAGATEPKDFQRRIGAVLFGEPGDHFGQAIALLAQTHRLPGMDGMNNRRFWQNDFPPSRSAAAIRQSADRLLALVRPAVEHLEKCQAQATVNADLLDSFLHGARRMELIGQRMLDGLEAAALYEKACEVPTQDRVALVEKVEQIVRRNRDAHHRLGEEFARLWLADCKPYALDWTMKRYQTMVAWYDGLLARLAEAKKAAQAGQALPSPETMGILQTPLDARRTRPHRVELHPLDPGSGWLVPEATHRLALRVGAGNAERTELPVQLDLPLPKELRDRPVRAFTTLPGTLGSPGQEGASGSRPVSPPQEPKATVRAIPAQIDPSETPSKVRLTLLLPGPIPKGHSATVWVYLGLAGGPSPSAKEEHSAGRANPGSLDRQERKGFQEVSALYPTVAFAHFVGGDPERKGFQEVSALYPTVAFVHFVGGDPERKGFQEVSALYPPVAFAHFVGGDPERKGFQEVSALAPMVPTPAGNSDPYLEGVRTLAGPAESQWLENSRVRVLLGPEGGHLYRWEVKALGNRDLTYPGEQGWAGFSDLGEPNRSARHRLERTACGPALVQYRAVDPTGLEKTISLFAGARWVEVILSEPVRYYWDFDDPKNFAADGPTPGEYLFSNGQSGPVGRAADGVQAQVAAPSVHWAIKFNPQKLALGMVLPETPAQMKVAPGGGAGGVGIEQSPPVSHFVTCAGVLDEEPKGCMDRLWRSLDFRNPPEVILYGLQANPSAHPPAGN